MFSDDILWCKDQSFFNKDIYVILDINDEIETMAFMTLCKGGAIIGNSTFSWWGGVLILDLILYEIQLLLQKSG